MDKTNFNVSQRCLLEGRRVREVEGRGGKEGGGAWVGEEGEYGVVIKK